MGGRAAGAMAAVWIGSLSGCSDGPRADEASTAPTSATATDGPGTTVGTTSAAASSSSAADILDLGDLDVPPPAPPLGCEAVDFLFVIDNSSSMATYQAGLADEFPSFIQAMYDTLPAGVSVHVALTTTDFDNGCDAPEATSGCQSSASLKEVQAHYRRPDEDPDGGNGTQGRLFDFGGRTYFASNTDEDPTELAAWFSDAAVAAGEDGCSFEMPVAAAGFAAHPSNAATNEGFLRDDGSLLVVFFLTDEPDKSLESRFVYEEMLLGAKAECGGAECILVSGLIPACTSRINQKLWQFMELFGEEPRWADIEQTNNYAALFGDALAASIAEACENIPAG